MIDDGALVGYGSLAPEPTSNIVCSRYSSWQVRICRFGRSLRITGISRSQRRMLRTPFFIANTPGSAEISSWVSRLYVAFVASMTPAAGERSEVRGHRQQIGKSAALTVNLRRHPAVVVGTD
jgi:hypothetical protein